MHNYALKVAYNGAPFCGFARQPGQLTVQGNLEDALKILTHTEIETVCAGRTDAGVHARGQVVNFLIGDNLVQTDSFLPVRVSGIRDQGLGISKKPTIVEPTNPYSLTPNPSNREQGLGVSGTEKILRSINALTHDGISVLEMKEVDEDFSARFSAKQREYRYFIYNKKTPPIFASDFSWHVAKPLDVESMREASQFLIGEHDFKSFCLACSSVDKTTMREVSDITLTSAEFFGEELLQITVKGNAFLHSMVRTIVGTLVEVGKAKKKPEWVKDVLAAKNRQAAGENAPAKGLVFWNVEY